MVELGVVGVVAGVEVDGVEELLDEEPLEAGAGETIATVDVELDDDPDEDGVEAAVVDAGEDAVLDAGLELSLGTPLANGLRAILASTTLTGSADAVVLVVVVCALVVVADGGAGTVGVVSAEPPLSRNAGMAATATTRIATTIHSLRSTRSRRSELILVLRSSWRPGRPTGRWWR
jgi:hypothetical protein